MPVAVAANDENNHHPIEKKRQSKLRTSFRFTRSMRLLSKRSQSMPVESVTTTTTPACEQPGQGLSARSEGKKRTRRITSLGFLRRSYSVSVLHSSDSNSISKASKGSKGSSATEDCQLSDEEQPGQSLMERTKIIAEQSSTRGIDEELKDIIEEEEVGASCSCATAILQHSYLEKMCCARNPSLSDLAESLQLPEDPTVQESIECIFASQLEDGLELWDSDDDELTLQPLSSERKGDVVSPAGVQQSRLNRSDRKPTFLSQSKKRYQQASLVYVGTYDPTIPDEEMLDVSQGPLPCPCTHSSLPVLNPRDWPQAPLLLRPTPGSDTRIKGIRLGNEENYLWEPGSHLTWPQCMAKRRGVPCQSKPRVGCCEKCAILPINNGNEEKGESLVIDFETDLFEGSLLLRLRHSEGTTPLPYDDNKGYFQGMNRRYQALIRGRFKENIPLTELVTGMQFKRPCGKLPPKWILRGGLKVLSFFAPQLHAKFEGDRPYSLTPLGSTPQSISVDPSEIDLLEDIREEPTDAKRTLLGEASLAGSSLQRARVRKKNFDKRFVQKAKEPKADTSKIYTFEFLQHLFNFQEFSVELGSMFGSVRLEELLAGQPLQIMAAHGDIPLWSFDVWHECLWDKAKEHEKKHR